MDPGTVGKIEGWDDRPFSGGYAGLRDLADADFTGAVSAGSAWLFMLNGRAIGVADGSLSSFEDADGTAYRAPYPGLPLLFAMQERGGETRAKYYTDDTPLGEVDRTLVDGNFTGYIELSENVLSGDYYVVYYGGRSMSLAFLGNAERLITEDEAFERASDEVGIFEVKNVDLDVLEIPGSVGSPPTDDGPVVDATPTDGANRAGAADEPDDDLGSEAIVDAEPVEEAEAVEQAEPVEETGEVEPAADPGTPTEAAGEPADRGAARDGSGPVEEGTPAGAAAETPPEEPGGDPFEEEEAWRRTRTIPALDPDESEGEVPGAADTRPVAESEEAPTAESSSAPSISQSAAEAAPAELRGALEEMESTIETLEARLDSATEERDELRQQADRLRRERNELHQQLESSGETPVAPAGGSIDRLDALAQTDLFIRYGSKGKATLEKAHDGAADREAVQANLRLEEHTRFDADASTVGGQPFRQFLQSQIEYRFASWLVEDLFFEIVDTGNQRRLRDLFDTLPQIDRADFQGTIAVHDEQGVEREETFDIVMRSRKGTPLLVANVNDQRDPATGSMMEALIGSATRVAEQHDDLGSVFFVTSSFFEPDALEAAEDATKGGLFDRDSRGSFVRVARKQGYHLCLVEARRDEFHVAVPDL